MDRTRESAPRWLRSDEVMQIIDAAMTRMGVSVNELARRAADRYGADAESVERRLRAARRPGRVMEVHTADRYLVLIGLHLTDVPTYRAALRGELPRDLWPRRATRFTLPRADDMARPASAPNIAPVAG